MLRALLVATYGQEAIDRVAEMAAESGLPHNPNPDVVPNSRRALRTGRVGPRVRPRCVPAHAQRADGRLLARWPEHR